MSSGMGWRDGCETDVRRPPSQPTVLVTGRSAQLLQSVAIRMFAGRACPDDGTVVVTTRNGPGGIVGQLTGGPDGLDHDRLAVIDCRRSCGSSAVEVGKLSTIDPVDDADALGGAVRTSLEWLLERCVERRHFLFDALASEVPIFDPETAYGVAYELAMTVGSEEGLAVFAAETVPLDPGTVEELAHLVDVHVETRRGRDGHEVRWSGLIGASDGWQEIDAIDFGHAGFR